MHERIRIVREVSKSTERTGPGRIRSRSLVRRIIQHGQRTRACPEYVGRCSVLQVSTAMFMPKHFVSRATIAVLLLAASLSTAVTCATDEAKGGQAPKAAVLQIVPPSRQKPQPGSVRLTNGLIFSGMCSKATTLAPVRKGAGPSDRLDQNLDVRLVDQEAREIYLSTRRSEPPALNNLVWPTLTFTIPQKRLERKSMPTGIPTVGPFDSDGIAIGKLYRTNGTADDIQVGIVAINELFANVSCLTHDWSYSIAFHAIPRDKLLSILSKAEGFRDDHTVRLNLVQMLIKANRLPEAAALFNTVKTDFPGLVDGQQYQQEIREQLARQITSVLEERRSIGQHHLVSNAARVHPKHDLTPETVVRVNQLVRSYDDNRQRTERIRAALPALIARIDDPVLRDSATRINRLVSSQIDDDTLSRFAAFELIASTIPDEAANNVGADPVPGDDGLPPEQQLAMAFSGWLMGAENSVKNLNDVVSLFDARQAILDYLNTDASESVIRQRLMEGILRTEGVGIDRVAAIVRNLPAIQPVRIETLFEGAVGTFTISDPGDSMDAIGIVPPEYHETRQYPVVIALHGRFDTRESYLGWWQVQAEKNGYIVVAPEWRKEQADEEESEKDPADTHYYDASAETHLRFLAFVRKLKNTLRIDDDRVFVAGHDLGGEIAMDMATSHPDLFAGIISVCGAGRRHLQWTAPNAILLPWYVVVGDSQGDWFDRMGTLAARFFHRDNEMDIDYDMVFIKYPFRGLEPYYEEADDVFEWMARQKRTPLPEKLYARLLRSSDLHWSWLRLKTLPTQFAQLDAPSDPTEGTYHPCELKARRDNRNLIRITATPSDLRLMLSPEMSGLDINKPIRVSTGRKTTSVDYAPRISDLLEELYDTGDRSRLCYMYVEVPK